MAGVYIVTGKLGSGKTLAAVGKIRDALQEGRPVATNLNLRLEKLVGRKAKNVRVYRLPDKPCVDDLHVLGNGNPTYDETKNGLIVLDECGTWFNAREWNDPKRRPLIDWLLHARKLGWDLLLIIQDISMIDKQARKSVAEHVVYCRRMDKLKYPIVDPIIKLFSGSNLPKPKIHMGVVKYGDLPDSLTVDRWWYQGKDIYPAYDTKQLFLEDYPHGMYQVLPPYYSHGRYGVKWTARNIMRITKIYLKRFSKAAVLSAGIFGGAAVASIFQPQPSPPVVQEQPEAEKEPSKSIADLIDTKPKERPPTVQELFSGFILDGVAANSQGEIIFVSIGNGEDRYNIETLRSQGLVVKMVNKCEVLIMNHDRTEQTRLYTSYCGPEKPPVTPPRMSPEERYKWKLDQVRAMERLKG